MFFLLSCHRKETAIEPTWRVCMWTLWRQCELMTPCWDAVFPSVPSQLGHSTVHQQTSTPLANDLFRPCNTTAKKTLGCLCFLCFFFLHWAKQRWHGTSLMCDLKKHVPQAKKKGVTRNTSSTLLTWHIITITWQTISPSAPKVGIPQTLCCHNFSYLFVCVSCQQLFNLPVVDCTHNTPHQLTPSQADWVPFLPRGGTKVSPITLLHVHFLKNSEAQYRQNCPFYEW